MKKTILLLCLLTALLLSACGEVPGDSTGTAGATDAPDSVQLTLHPEDHNQSYFMTSFVETPEGYYYGREEGLESTRDLIYFCPRGGDTFVPLCGKPNCPHHDENCNAWYGNGRTDSFGYYDGALYSAVYEYDKYLVYRIQLDGTGHEHVATVDLSKLQDYGFFAPVFHHGKLIINCDAPQELPAEEREDHVIVMDLSDFSQTEPGADFLKTAHFPKPLNWFYKDKVYGIGTGDKRLDYSPSELKLIELDLTTGKIRIPLPRLVSGLYMTDSTWYFFERDLSQFEPTSQDANPGFREYDVESGTIKECGMPAADIICADYDTDCIYARSDDRSSKDYSIYFLSRDYSLLDTLELDIDSSIAAIASDRIFFDGNGNGNFAYYLDKSEIGSHNLELKPVKHAG